MTDLATGTEFAGCRVEAVVGRGGMGVIYRASDLRLKRPVAIKLIADERAADPGFRERFEREARLTASVDHPNVIPIYAAGEERGHLYLVMRYVGGTDLQALLRQTGRLEPGRAAAVVAQVAEALDAAHAAGLVHRDVKPANVLLAGEHVYLSDFGITRAVDAQTDTGQALGTVDFMAPEHLRGERTDARSDVYALGCLLHTALTGTPPFHRATVPATILAHLEEEAPRPSATPGVPAAMDAVLARALARDPGDRYPSAGDLGRAAQAAAVGRPDAPQLGSVARGPAAPPVAPLAPDGAERSTVVTPAGGVTARQPRPAAEAPTHRVVRSRPRRRRLGFGVLAIVIAAILAGTGLVLARPGAKPNGPLSASEVRGLAYRFAHAYGTSNPREMGALLAADAERVSAGTVQRGRDAVLAEYRRQFAGNPIRGYQLSGLVVSGGWAGRAAAQFAVPRAGLPSITGDVVLGVERVGGTPQIRLITTGPLS